MTMTQNVEMFAISLQRSVCIAAPALYRYFEQLANYPSSHILEIRNWIVNPSSDQNQVVSIFLYFSSFILNK